MKEAVRIQDAKAEEGKDHAGDDKGHDESVAASRAGFATEFYYLMRREYLNLIRDKASMIARIGITLFINGLIGFIFTGKSSSNCVYLLRVSPLIG